MGKMKEALDIIWKKGLLHIMTGTFAIKIVSFFGSIFLVRVLSKEEYGILGYLENIYGYAFVLAGLGVSNAILRYVVLGDSLQDKYNYFAYACRRGIICNLILTGFIGILSVFYPHPMPYRNYIWLLLILLMGLPFQYLCDNVLCNERAMFSNQKYACLSLMLSSSIIFSKILFGNTAGIKGAIFGQVLVYIILALFFYKLTKEKYYVGLSVNKLANRERKKVNIFSLQYMITNGLWAIFMLNDTFLLGRFCSPEIIANYKVAYAIPGSVSLISSSIGVFITPYFVRNEKDKAWVRKNFLKTYVVSAVFVAVLCAGIAVMARPVILLLYGTQYLEAVQIMRILLLAAFFNCGLRYTTANILAAMGLVKYNMWVSLLGIIAQMGINIIVIPVYGVTGMAITSCTIYAGMAFLLLYLFLREYTADGAI